MKKTIEMLEARINLLKQRGETMNQGIINKIKREIKKRERESITLVVLLLKINYLFKAL